MFSNAQLDVINFCAEEVTRQHDSPKAVGWMLNAWNLASALSEPKPQKLTVHIIEELGKLVSPYINIYGLRTCFVQIGNSLPPAPALVYGLLVDFVKNIPKDPASAYKAFEEIHPFRDGNGRVGKIIFNWLNETLDNPRFPPNFWGTSNP